MKSLLLLIPLVALTALAVTPAMKTEPTLIGFQQGVYVGKKTFPTVSGTASQAILTAAPAPAPQTLSLGAVGAAACIDSSAITVVGAKTSDPCVVGVAPTPGAQQLQYSCYVSSADNVKIHVCNPTAGSITSTASSVFNLRVLSNQ